MKNRIINFLQISFFAFLLAINLGYSQGGVITNKDATEEGYVLFKEAASSWTSSNVNIYLMNNCGQIVNTWDGDILYYTHAKLLPNGNIIFHDGTTIYEKSWDNELLNTVTLNSFDTQIDYEVIKLENGNYLSVGRKYLDYAGFQALGFIPDNGDPDVVDVVMELDSISGEILWEWNISDHSIQERDPTKSNYGIVAEHPELLNIDAISTYDWSWHESFMINGFDYNPELEQIMVSVRKMSEVVIIDRSTTTEEASGHTGGNSGKGGDVLFRWGNPGNYTDGSFDERKLYFQHNPKWIKYGPHKGKISMFNNGLSREFDGPRFSEGPVVDTHVDSQGNYSLDSNNQFSSGEADIYYRAAEESDFFQSDYLSGVEMMPNGNAYFTVGQENKFYEVTEEGEIVWEFILPGSSDPFRTEKYPIDYPAFANKELIPIEYVPGTTPHPDCSLSSSNELDKELSQVTVVHLHNENLEIYNHQNLNLIYTLFDSQGKTYSSIKTNQANIEVNLTDLRSGIYMMHVINPVTGQIKNHTFVQTNK